MSQTTPDCRHKCQTSLRGMETTSPLALLVCGRPGTNRGHACVAMLRSWIGAMTSLSSAWRCVCPKDCFGRSGRSGDCVSHRDTKSNGYSALSSPYLGILPLKCFSACLVTRSASSSPGIGARAMAVDVMPRISQALMSAAHHGCGPELPRDSDNGCYLSLLLHQSS